MARTDLPVTNIIREDPGNPGTLTVADDATDHEFINDGRTVICALNTAVAAALTFKTPGTIDGLAIAEQIVNVGIHVTKVTMIGPFPPGVYNQSDGVVHIDVDTDTTLWLGAFRLPA